MKEYADRKRKAIESQIKKRDTVLMKNIKLGKLQPNFDPKPFKVIEKQRKKVIIENEEGTLCIGSKEIW